MGSSNRLAFRRHVSKLDRAELAAFLAELWDARGLLVEHTDHRLVTTDPVTGERRFVMINPARESLSLRAPNIGDKCVD